MDTYFALVDDLVEQHVLKTKRIIDAFYAVHRKAFLPASLKGQEGIDAPLPIGHGQTISQPYTVAFMLELLSPEPGQKVMDVGYGSGWTSALLAHMVGVKGKVYSIEIVPDLCNFGKENIAAFNFIKKGRVKTFCQDGSKGLPEHAPFHRILAGASASKLPQAWIDQLAKGGKVTTPIGESVWCFEKGGNEVIGSEYPGFLFVPLTHES